MNEPGSDNFALAITGVGMVTAVGHDAPTAHASLRADIPMMKELRIPDRSGHPIVGAPISEIADTLLYERRLAVLAKKGATEAVRDARSSGQDFARGRVAVLWITAPSSRPGFRCGFAEQEKQQLLKAIGFDVNARWQDLEIGSAGAIEGLRIAEQWIRDRQVDACLLVGADSLIQLRVLRWLENMDRLKTETYVDGLIPGEAAVGIVVEGLSATRQRSGNPKAIVAGLGLHEEPGHLLSNQPCRATGLTSAVRQAIQFANASLANIHQIHCDLNGESYRAREFGLLLTRLQAPADVAVNHPADCIGDVGAVAGLVLLAHAASWHVSGTETETDLLLVGSETGERGAAILHREFARPGSATLLAPKSQENAPDLGIRGALKKELLEQHYDELQFLWSQRQSAVQSTEHFPKDLARLENRLENHLQGLLQGGLDAAAIVREGLAADDPVATFSAAYTMLRFGHPQAARRVFQAFSQSEGEKRDGLREALCHGPIGAIEDDLRSAFAAANSPLSAAAAEILAFHGRLTQPLPRLVQLLTDTNPEVRRSAWRTVSLLGDIELH
ncbi:MAG: hypothetical protein U1D30_22075 [Planctomycetota bacterium]